MIVQSSNLEILAVISEKELSMLPIRSLKGTLNFTDRNIPLKRDISFVFQYSPKQLGLLVVEQQPRNVYFGEADRVEVFINPEFYNILSANREFGQRFWTSGKFEVMISDTKYPQTL